MLIVASAATMLPACKTVRQLPPTVTDTCTITETVRDTVFTVTPDTAAISALVRCGEDNRLLLQRIQTDQGSRVKADITVKPSSDGKSAVLEIECAADSLRHELQLRDREISRLRNATHTIQVPRPLTWLQTTTMIFGWAFISVLLGIVAAQVIKKLKH